MIVADDGQVKVADFGLAKIVSDDSASLATSRFGVGTPDYVAPEQVRGVNVDHRADIFSLGVMLYEMLCGEAPKGVFEPPSHRVGCDPRIDRIVIRAMQRSPDERYQTAQELKADLAAALAPPAADESMPAVPSSPTSKKRNLRRYAGIAVAALSIVGGMFVFERTRRTHGSEPSARSVVTAALKPGEIKLWDAADQLDKKSGVRWEDNAVRLDETNLTYTRVKSRDMIFHPRVRMNTDAIAPQLDLRTMGTKAQGNEKHYVLSIQPSKKTIVFSSFADGSFHPLMEWPLPPAYGADDWALLEARALGDKTTVSIDGHVLGCVYDTSQPQPGGVMLYAKAKGYFRDVGYVPLDNVSTPIPARVSNHPLNSHVESVPESR